MIPGSSRVWRTRGESRWPGPAMRILFCSIPAARLPKEERHRVRELWSLQWPMIFRWRCRKARHGADSWADHVEVAAAAVAATLAVPPKQQGNDTGSERGGSAVFYTQGQLTGRLWPSEKSRTDGMSVWILSKADREQLVQPGHTPPRRLSRHGPTRGRDLRDDLPRGWRATAQVHDDQRDGSDPYPPRRVGVEAQQG